MSDLARIKERYLRDDLPVRLGNLAANLARVSVFLTNPANHRAVDSLLTESKFFIEWSAAETEVEIAAELIEMQVQIARWQIRLTSILNDPAHQVQVAEQAQQWSKRVLHVSGLTQAA